MFHCFNLTHDLEANGFFAGPAVPSRGLLDQGLYHWVGEAQQRVLFRARSKDGVDGRLPASDGWGRYLAPTGSITFDLEWDRGTESMKRLGDKVRGYMEHFSHRRNAEYRHVLFVLPTVAREHHLHELIGNAFAMGMLNCSRLADEPAAPRVGRAARSPLAACAAGKGAGRLEGAETRFRRPSPDARRAAGAPRSRLRRPREHRQAEVVGLATWRRGERMKVVGDPGPASLPSFRLRLAPPRGQNLPKLAEREGFEPPIALRL